MDEFQAVQSVNILIEHFGIGELHSKGLPHRRRAIAKAAGHDPQDYSLYFGRQRLGLVRKIAPRQFEAFTARGRYIGCFKTVMQAMSAVPKPRGLRS
jgi:hypothetical protein